MLSSRSEAAQNRRHPFGLGVAIQKTVQGELRAAKGDTDTKPGKSGKAAEDGAPKLARVGEPALTLPVAAREFPVIAGRGRLESTEIFVSRGVGTVYVPLRLNCPPEAAILTLQPVMPMV